MARSAKLRDELLQLLSDPAVQRGFAGAAARYIAQLESGARVGAAGVLAGLWWGSLFDVTRSALGDVNLGWRFHLGKEDRLAFLGHLRRWALRLHSGEVVASAREVMAALPHEKVALAGWAQEYGVTALLDCDVAQIGSFRIGGTVRHAITASRERGYEMREAIAQTSAFLVREAGIVIPGVPPHVRAAVLPELAVFHEAVAGARAKLPAGHSRDGRMVLDARHSPPVIFVGHWHEQIGVHVATEAELDVVWSNDRRPNDERLGAVLESVLDLLAWPTAAEREVLIRALTPRWTELVRALEQARPQGDSVVAAAPRDERLAFRLQPGHGVELVVQKRALRNKKGALPAGALADGWTVGKVTLRQDLPANVEPSDLAIVTRLRSMWSVRTGDWTVENLRALIGHPRVFLAGGAQVHIDEVPTRIAVSVQGDGNRLQLMRGDDVVTVERMRHLLYQAGGLIDDSKIADGHICLTRVASEHVPVIKALLAVGGDIPPDGRDALLRALGPLESLPHFDIDPRLLGEQLEAKPRIVVRFTPDGEHLTLAVLVRVLPEANAFAWQGGPDRVVVTRDGARAFCLRDREAERQLCAALLATPLLTQALEQALDHNEHGWHLTGDAACDVVAAVQSLATDDAFVIEWPASSSWRVAEAKANALKLRVGGSALTLHLQGEVVVDEHAVELVRLLDAARVGRRYVTLSPGRFLALSDELRAQVAALADAGTVDGTKLIGGAGLALALEELVATGAVMEGKKVWQTWRSRLAAAVDVDDKVPRGLEAELRPYQREGLRFLRRLVALETGGVLADDMGLGKTLQALALLVDRAKQGPALVLAPTSVCSNWQREMERFAPTLRPRVLHDADDRSALLAGLKGRDVLIASYGLLVREEEAFASREFATLIIDEAQAIKNAASQRARAVRRLNARARFALTGTPLENHTGELWSIFQAVAPGLLPSQEEFRARFQGPIDRDRNPDRRRALARLIRPFLLRRVKAEVAPELPARTEIVLRIELSPAERQHYDALRAVLAEKIRASSAEPMQKRVLILSALTRLRQVACHPALDSTASEQRDTPSSKLVELSRLVADLKENQHRVLVFSQFTRLLDLCEPVLHKAGVSFVRLDGSTSVKNRARAIDAFQAGEADVFLLSLKAGGFGLNLTAADYVIHLDPWWNPAAEMQASDRAHRIGQTRPVTIYRMVASGTLEEGVLAMQQHKREIFAGVLDGQDVVGARFDETELMSLFDDAAAALAPSPSTRR